MYLWMLSVFFCCWVKLGSLGVGEVCEEVGRDRLVLGLLFLLFVLLDLFGVMIYFGGSKGWG